MANSWPLIHTLFIGTTLSSSVGNRWSVLTRRSPPWSQRAVAHHKDVWAHHGFSQSIPMTIVGNNQYPWPIPHQIFGWYSTGGPDDRGDAAWPLLWECEEIGPIGRAKGPHNESHQKRGGRFWVSSTHNCSSHNSWQTHKTVSILKISRGISR